MSDWDNEFGGEAFDLEVEREKRKLCKTSGKNFNSLQQLKAEIAALVQRYESADRKIDFAIWFRTQVERLRQLSAV